MDSAAIAVQSDTKPAKRKPGQRGKDLTGTEVADIIRWHGQGLTQQQIADKFVPPRAQSAISEVLAKFGTDRTAEAKAILRGSAPDMALNIVKNGKPKDQVQALAGLGVLHQQDSGGLTLIINGLALHGTNQDVVDAEVLSPPLIEGHSEGEQNS